MQLSGEYSSHPPGDSAAVRTPLNNLETVRLRMDSLHQFLVHSVNTNTAIDKDQTATISSEITSAVNQIIVNGTAIIRQTPTLATAVFPAKKSQISDRKGFDSDCEIVELDAVELLAEHIHFCEICGKGFKRDANLRMHMRAHGNQYKTPEALTKPDKELKNSSAKRRFSCPFQGCNRNQNHLKFRPLKSVICVKNHFKRTHCPKLYSCNRCNKKSFSVVADLKSHLKHCGAGGRGGEATKWRCSCGTSFSRKDKLFGHVGLFEGHMPAVVMEESEGDKGAELRWSGLESAGLEDSLEGFGSMEGSLLEDVVGWNSYFYGGGPV